MKGKSALLATWALFGVATAQAQVTLIDSWNTGLGTLNAIAYDPGSDHVYAHSSFAALHRVYTSNGTLFGTFPSAGASTNDSDYSINFMPVNIGGTPVPSGSFITVNGETDPQTLFAQDIFSGTVIATVTLQESIGQLTGGGFAPDGSFVAIDWTVDQIIRFDPTDGSQIDKFGFGGGWDAFYSDVEVASNGSLVLVSSSQNTIRILSANGAFIRDIAVGAAGVSGMSGIALVPGTDEAFISSTNGMVYHIDGLEGVPEPQTYALMALGGAMVGWFFWRRRKA